MGNYENLKQSITEVIRTNGNQEITGAVLQSTLLTIISTVGANSTFVGIATPTTNPGTPDGPVFYLASESGTYPNFGGIELQDGLSVLMWNGSWSSQRIFSPNRFGYNVTVFGLVTGVHTLATAVKNVPLTERFGGQKITFKTDSGWVTYQNTSLDISDYENVTNWVLDSGVSELGDVTITNNPDYEDLTQNEGGQLKFADKTYNAATYTGLGRKYLRKNIAGGVNILTQDMLVDANTIYHIQYDYTLGENITIPKNCILEFDGGKISGAYTITGNNTGIEARLVKIFGTDVTLAGSWNVVEAYPEWFGAVRDGNTDDTDAIQKAIDFCDRTYGGIIRLLNGMYVITGVTTGVKTSIVGANSGATIVKVIGNNNGITVPIKSRGFRIEHLTLYGSFETNSDCGDGIHLNTPYDQATGEGAVYMRSLVPSNSDIIPTYSWVTINDVYVTYFKVGLNIELFLNADTKVMNSTFCFCYEGVRFGATDSSMYDCYINNNRRFGIFINGTNNKFARLKSIFNGQGDGDQAAIHVYGGKNILSDCETQDNYCNGYNIHGVDNVITGCVSNTDGYKPEGTYHDTTKEKCPFVITVDHSRISMANNLIFFYKNLDGVSYEPIKDVSGSKRLPSGITMKAGDEQWVYWKELTPSLNYFNTHKVNGSVTISEIESRKYIVSTDSTDAANIEFTDKIRGNFAILFDLIIPNSISGGTGSIPIKLDNNIEVFLNFWPTNITLQVNNGGTTLINTKIEGNANKGHERRFLLMFKDGKIGIYGIVNKTNDNTSQTAFVTHFKEADLASINPFKKVYIDKGATGFGVSHLIVTRDVDIIDNLLYLVPTYDFSELCNNALAVVDAETYNASDFA